MRSSHLCIESLSMSSELYLNKQALEKLRISMFLDLMSADTKETLVFHNCQWWKGNMEKKIQHAGNTDCNNSYIQTHFFLNLSLFHSMCSAPFQEPVMRYEKIRRKLTL